MRILIPIFILILTSSCTNTEYVEVISYDVDILDPLQLDHKSGETVILMGKIIPLGGTKDEVSYQYFINALDGTWIETNKKFHLGDTLILNGLPPLDSPEGTTVIFSEFKVE